MREEEENEEEKEKEKDEGEGGRGEGSEKFWAKLHYSFFPMNSLFIIYSSNHI